MNCPTVSASDFRKKVVSSLRQNWLVVAAILSLGLFQPSSLMAQGTAEQKLTEAYTLEREGKPAPAIALLQSLLDSGSFDSAHTAKAWDVLGLALKDQGDYTGSRRAFEQSLEAYEALPAATSDRATALDDFAELHVLIGQLDLAERMMKNALQLYESAGDHAGVVRGSNYLTGVFFSQKKVREGRRVLMLAEKESRLATELDDDDRATLVSLQGWSATFDGDWETSVSMYRQSLDLLRKHHGEEHPSTGWAYVLLAKAHAECGSLHSSLSEMRKGIAILGRTLSKQDSRFLTAEIAYSHALEIAGERVEAQRLRAEAEEGMDSLQKLQCFDCTVSAKALR